MSAHPLRLRPLMDKRGAARSASDKRGAAPSAIPRLAALALWLCGAPALAAPRCVATEDPAQKKLARRLWEDAQRLFQEQRKAAEALALLERSYQLSCSPKLLINIAQLYDELGRRAEAIERVERFLEGPGSSDASIIADAKRYLAELRLVTVTLAWSPPEARVSVDGKPVAGAGLATLPLPLGPHRVQASGPLGFGSLDQTLVVSLGMAPLKLTLPSTRVPVALSWSPPDAEILVDGAPVRGQGGAATLQLVPGAHALQAQAVGYATQRQVLLAEPGAPAVRVTMSPEVTAQLRTPRGSAVLIDDARIEGSRALPGSLLQEVRAPLRPGLHQLQVVGPRGRRVTQTFFAALNPERRGQPLEIEVPPPSLRGGLWLGGAGLLSLAVGGALVGADAATCAGASCGGAALAQSGYGLIAIGATVLLPALVWLGSSAANQPR